MRRLLRAPTVIVALGVCLLVLGLVAGVAAGGVPYPDGPNAGHLAPPGFRRWLEYACSPMIATGAILTAASFVAVAVVGAVIGVRRFSR